MCRYEEGIPLSPIVSVTCKRASGSEVQKSQLVFGLRILVRGSLLTAWFKSINFIGSLKKNTGVLFPTRSQFPSSVSNRMENTRISRSDSEAQRSPASIE